MQIQRTITILLPDDPDLRDTLSKFRTVLNALSEPCFNEGKPLHSIPLYRKCYKSVKGSVSSQMTNTATRIVAGAYVSARKGYQRHLKMEAERKEKYFRKGWNYKPRVIKKPGVCQFNHALAVFAVGSRGRDADFRKDGTLSIWTTAGRKRLSYIIPPAFKEDFKNSVEIDSMTLIERNGNLYGNVTLTLEVPDPKGIHPVGIDRGEINTIVAVDTESNTFFESGLDYKIRNRRTQKTRSRLQSKLASLKAQKKDTHSVRRLLKRQGRKNSNRTRTFCQQTAKRLCEWVKPDSVLVFEDLKVPPPQKGTVGSKNKEKAKSIRRRLSRWQHGIMRKCVENRAQRVGLAVSDVNPAYTSQDCSRCGLRGIRRKHQFKCPHCKFIEHADINASACVRNRFIVRRYSTSYDEQFTARKCSGDQSMSPEALALTILRTSRANRLLLGSGS